MKKTTKHLIIYNVETDGYLAVDDNEDIFYIEDASFAKLFSVKSEVVDFIMDFELELSSDVKILEVDVVIEVTPNFNKDLVPTISDVIEDKKNAAVSATPYIDTNLDLFKDQWNNPNVAPLGPISPMIGKITCTGDTPENWVTTSGTAYNDMVKYDDSVPDAYMSISNAPDQISIQSQSVIDFVEDSLNESNK